jgi:hypothetical protein
MRDPDEELVRRVGAGDKRAAAELVRRHLSRMVGLARRMLGDHAEAEDVAQEVFLRVWKHASAWQPGQAKFETWMHRVAMNLCLDRLRRRGRQGGEVSPETPDVRASATRALDDRQRRDRVRDALAGPCPSVSGPRWCFAIIRTGQTSRRRKSSASALMLLRACFRAHAGHSNRPCRRSVRIC